MLFFAIALVVAAVAARSVPQHLDSRQATGLPSTFTWSSSASLVSAKNDGRGVSGVKDPSVIYYNNTYHVFASTAQLSGYSMVYFNFTDFSKAGAAPFFYLDKSGIGTGYRAAPEVFYFAPQKLWYLIYQNGNAAYSTNPDISNPAGWTAPKTFYSGTPALIAEGLLNPAQGYWVDMWVICDAVNCHLFSHDDNGRLYRSQTTLANFPAGMSEPVIALQDANKNNLFEAAAVYNVGNGTYLLIVECIGDGVSAGGVRYFRSWTSHNLAGPWTALAATQQNPIMGAANVAFSGTPWTVSISHGEMVRTNVDQTLSLKPCEMRFMYQGINPNAAGSYNELPWTLGLLTQTNSKC